MLLKSGGVPTRKEKISREEYFTAVDVSIRVFFAILLAVAASDVTDSESFSVCVLEEVYRNFKKISEDFLALSLVCTDSRDLICLI